MKTISLMFTAAFLLIGCAGKPVTVEPVQGFNADRYLGTWYEIARLDHSFERGLTNVTATYSYREDGMIKVLNRGVEAGKEEYNEAVGKAKFATDSQTGHLKVSFFGPFYGDYIIFDLDQDAYAYAFISGGKDNYLWLLAREPRVSDELKARFVEEAKSLGYDTDALIWVDQSRSNAG